MLNYTVSLGFALLISLLFTFDATAARPSKARPSVFALEGDVVVIHNRAYRLYGIDAPELGQTCEIDGEKRDCGREALKTLQRLILNKRVECYGHEVDDYGRLIAECLADNISLNELMVLEGMAVAYLPQSRMYINLEADARDRAAGMWGGKFMRPREWRRRYSGSKHMAGYRW